MVCSKQEQLIKFFKWAYLLILTLSAIWFMHDVLQKYHRKDTALKRYEDIRNETPTTVICFKPFIKQSVLEKYNISLYEYQTLLKVQKFPQSWTEFYLEAFYHLNKDFNISLRDHPNLIQGYLYQ